MGELPTVMIAVTFFLGVALVLLAGFALLRRVGGGGGSLSMLGITISGASGPALFLVVGAVMTLSGFGWASAQREVETKTLEVAAKTTEVAQKDKEISRIAADVNLLASEIGRVQQAYDGQRDLNRILASRAPHVVEGLPADQKTWLMAPKVELSPAARSAIERFHQ